MPRKATAYLNPQGLLDVPTAKGGPELAKANAQAKQQNALTLANELSERLHSRRHTVTSLKQWRLRLIDAVAKGKITAAVGSLLSAEAASVQDLVLAEHEQATEAKAARLLGEQLRLRASS